jgi:hypothetical protein
MRRENHAEQRDKCKSEADRDLKRPSGERAELAARVVEGPEPSAAESTDALVEQRDKKGHTDADERARQENADLGAE